MLSPLRGHDTNQCLGLRRVSLSTVKECNDVEEEDDEAEDEYDEVYDEEDAEDAEDNIADDGEF